MYTDRVPPCDEQAENSVIGSLLLDGESISRVSSFLKADDFYQDKNKFCYQACLDLVGRNEAINQVTVSHELTIHDRIDVVGGIEYLSYLTNAVPNPTHITHFAHIVHNASIMRQLIQAATDIARLGYENAPNTEDTLSRSEELLFNIRSGRGYRDFSHS